MSYILSLEGSLPLPLIAAYLVVGTAVFCFLCLALRIKRKEAYSSAFFFFGAILCICVFFSEEGGGEGALLTGLACLAVYGITYPALLFSLAYMRRRRAKERALMEERRVEKFLLPDSKNSYLRDRLQTGLCVKTEEEIPIEQAFQLPFVRHMIVKLKEKDLAPADRVEAESIGEELSALCGQKTLTCAQLSLVNARFARLLKLAAKYAV